MRTRSLAGVVAAAAAGMLALAACGNGSSGGGGGNTGGGLGGGATGGGSNQTYNIGFEGPLSGDNAQLGINERNGAKLAVDEANAKGDLGFKLVLKEQDDVGDPSKSPAAATQLIQDKVVGVIGPSFSGSTKAVGAQYSSAGVPFITPSATNPTLSTLGFKTFHRIVPDDNVEGTQGADWLAKKGIKKVYVVDDLSDYGTGVSGAVMKELKAKGVPYVHQGVDAKQTDYSGVATTVTSSGAGALFYAGYDAQAALFAKALVSASFKGITVTGNGGKSSVFSKNSGTAGNNWYFTCGCQDATTATEAKAFNDAYQKAFNTPPSTYSPEAYDATNALIQAIKDAKSKGAVTADSVNTAVNALDYKGITTEIKFQSNGDVEASAQTVNLYQQTSGAIKLLGNIKEQS